MVRHPEERLLRRRISKCRDVESTASHLEILRFAQDDGLLNPRNSVLGTRYSVLVWSLQPLPGLRGDHSQRIVDPIEVVEESCHRRDLYDLAFVVELPEPGEHCVIDRVGLDRELSRVSKSRLFRVAERTAIEFQQRRELLLGGSMPRSLRGVRARSVFAAVDPRDERRDQLPGAD